MQNIDVCRNPDPASFKIWIRPFFRYGSRSLNHVVPMTCGCHNKANPNKSLKKKIIYTYIKPSRQNIFLNSKLNATFWNTF